MAMRTHYEVVSEDDFLKRVQWDDRYTAEEKKMILGGYQFYLDTGHVSGFFGQYIRYNYISLSGLGTPQPDMKKYLANQIASAFDFIDLGEGRIAPQEERGTGRWRIVHGGRHVLGVKWDRTGQGRNAPGILQIAFGTGGKVIPPQYPVYSWHSIRYRTYEYIWKEANSPGSYIWKNMPRGRLEGWVTLKLSSLM